MGEIIADYFANNWNSLLQGLFFSFLGAIFGALITPKQTNPAINNSTSINETTNIIVKKIYVSKGKEKNSKKDDNAHLIGLVYLGVMIIITYLYIKYQSYIMDFILGYTLMGLFATFAISLKLYINNSYDRLNKLWTTLLLFIWLINFIQLGIMSEQIKSKVSVVSISSFIESVGLDGLSEYFYYVTGLIVLLVVNAFTLILFVNILSVNRYRVYGGKITKFLTIKTNQFIQKPKMITTVVIILSILSVLLSMGLVYDLISNS